MFPLWRLLVYWRVSWADRVERRRSWRWISSPLCLWPRSDSLIIISHSMSQCIDLAVTINGFLTRPVTVNKVSSVGHAILAVLCYRPEDKIKPVKLKAWLYSVFYLLKTNPTKRPKPTTDWSCFVITIKNTYICISHIIHLHVQINSPSVNAIEEIMNTCVNWDFTVLILMINRICFDCPEKTGFGELSLEVVYKTLLWLIITIIIILICVWYCFPPQNSSIFY